MITAERTQTLTDFRAAVSETLDRINQTGEAEIITVDGDARGVLLSPAVYDQLARETQVTRDVAVMRKAMTEIDQGKGLDARAAFDSLREELLTMKASQDGTAA